MLQVKQPYSKNSKSEMFLRHLRTDKTLLLVVFDLHALNPELDPWCNCHNQEGVGQFHILYYF